MVVSALLKNVIITPLSSYSPLSVSSSPDPAHLSLRAGWLPKINQHWLLWMTASFLVSVPVFIQAPLVRLWPELSLGMTVLWLGLSLGLLRQASTRFWGDLLLGFSWTWLAGSLYWGWLRWEPLWHLPVESLALPVVLYLLYRRQLPIGSWFYLGSLCGTAITDLYFYAVDLIPQWRQLMQVDLAMAMPVFQAALSKMQTLWGINCALLLSTILIVVGLSALQTRKLPHWGFSGAVLSTLLVDGLFWLSATQIGF